VEVLFRFQSAFALPNRGWREDPADKRREWQAGLNRAINVRFTSPLATG
jgi:hypothetical protein